MLKRLLFLLLGLGLLPGRARAQEGRITGRVVNQATKDPVAFASISLRDEGTGALTNEYGYFQLAMPERSPGDSIVVVALGFRRTALILVGRVLATDSFSESSLYRAGHAHLYRP